MNINKLVRHSHDVFYDAYDAYDLLVLLVRLKNNWLKAAS